MRTNEVDVETKKHKVVGGEIEDGIEIVVGCEIAPP